MAQALAGPRETGLVRTIGTRTLTLAIVNTTVGAGIFLLPSAVASGVGGAAPLAYLVCAGLMALVVACFAVAGSRVSITGGPYAYVESAFGPFVAFLVGVLLWCTNVLGVAGIASAFASAVGLVVPGLSALPSRAALLAVVLAALAALNVRGARLGTHLVVTMTLAKLAPLVVFVAVGIFYVHPTNFAWPGLPPAAPLGETVLILIFAFVGMEVALVPSGEVENPGRTVPQAVFSALAVTTLLYLAIQFVAQGVLGQGLRAAADAPLAEASARFLGNGGRALVLAGGIVSMFGYLSGDMLATPRLLFAFGRDRFIPAWFASVHPRFHTPHTAILTHAVIVWVLGLMGTFGQLALLSNVAVLTLYLVCCAAAWQITRSGRQSVAGWSLPGGGLIPLLGCLSVTWVLSHATWVEFVVELVVLVAGSAAYFIRKQRHLAREPN